MSRFRLGKRLVLALMVFASLGFETLDNCALCHQAAPTPDEHLPMSSVSWPVCGTCHGSGVERDEANAMITGLHESHVGKQGFDCGVCHSFSADEEADARQRQGRMLENPASD